jgi:hypothetical protein
MPTPPAGLGGGHTQTGRTSRLTTRSSNTWETNVLSGKHGLQNSVGHSEAGDCDRPSNRREKCSGGSIPTEGQAGLGEAPDRGRGGGGEEGPPTGGPSSMWWLPACNCPPACAEVDPCRPTLGGMGELRVAVLAPLTVLPLAGGRFLRPTKEGGGRRERSPRAVRAGRVGGATRSPLVGDYL